MIIRNLLNYKNENAELAHLYIHNNETTFFSSLHDLPPATQVYDAAQDYVVFNGWLDSHIHGTAGHDFSEGTTESLEIITKALGEKGVAYCMATLVSLDLNKLKSVLTVINDYVVAQQHAPTPGSTQICGIHLEGPFIAKNCKGAHDEQILQEKIDIELFKNIIASAPQIKHWKITLAPDLPGAIEFIQQSKDLVINNQKINVNVFIGHTNANEQQIQAAIEAGAVGFTHLGNANQETAQRLQDTIEMKDIQSHVVKWAIKNPNTPVELIMDRQHLSEAFILFILKHLKNNIILITDALSPSGMPDGEYQLGSLSVVKMGEKIELKDQSGKLAGSAATLATMVENYFQILRKSGKTIEETIEAIQYATVIHPRKTSILDMTKLSDNFVILNKQTGQLVMSTCHGEIKWHLPLTALEIQESNSPTAESLTPVQSDEESDSSSDISTETFDQATLDQLYLMLNTTLLIGQEDRLAKISEKLDELAAFMIKQKNKLARFEELLSEITEKSGAANKNNTCSSTQLATNADCLFSKKSDFRISNRTTDELSTVEENTYPCKG